MQAHTHTHTHTHTSTCKMRCVEILQAIEQHILDHIAVHAVPAAKRAPKSRLSQTTIKRLHSRDVLRSELQLVLDALVL